MRLPPSSTPCRPPPAHGERHDASRFFSDNDGRAGARTKINFIAYVLAIAESGAAFSGQRCAAPAAHGFTTPQGAWLLSGE
jgi:hypothetical protein